MSLYNGVLSVDLRALAKKIQNSFTSLHKIDQARTFAVAHRDALMKDQDALGQNGAFSGIVASFSNPDHADMMENYGKEHFGPDALVQAQRVGNGIRLRAALKLRLLPPVRAALQ